MNEGAVGPTDKRDRFPPAIVAHAIWLYFRFVLSYRDVAEPPAEGGVLVTDATIRHHCRKFGQAFANELRCRRSRPPSSCTRYPGGSRLYRAW